MRTMQRTGTFTAEAAAAYNAQFDEPERVAASVQLYRQFLTRSLPALIDRRGTAGRLTVPTLVIHGTADPVLRPSLLEGLHHHIDDLRIRLVPDADHFVAESAPAQVLDELLPFLSEAASSSGSSSPHR